MNRATVRLGCDPELFIRHKEKIIGSEFVLGTTGIDSDGGMIVPDGVQAELNPRPNTCRERLIGAIRECLVRLNQTAYNKECDLDFSQSVEIEKTQFDALSDKCKEFGCKPSFNIDPTQPLIMLLDASKYLTRSAGGHIHIGAYEGITKEKLQDVNRIIPILDLIVGNTCVMLDRSEANIERRKHYGRGGEYRLPSYGIEYRTLSNFWLRAPQLVSLVFGLARHAVDLVYNDLDIDIMKLVDYSEVTKAINTNDYDLALSNWNKIKTKFIEDVNINDNFILGYRYPIDKNNLDKFDKMLANMKDVNGLDRYFTKDVLKTWMKDPYGWIGFYKFVVETKHD